MAEGLIPALDSVLQALPKDSPEAAKLELIIYALKDSSQINAEEWIKLRDDLANERKARQEAEQKLATCSKELARLRSIS